MEVTTKKQNRRKIVIGVLIAVVVLVSAVIAFASSYLVNYAIGSSGDGGDREVALDVEAPTDGVEQLIAENRAVQKQANEEFLQQNPGQTEQITAADGLRLNGVYYPLSLIHICKAGGAGAVIGIYCFNQADGANADKIILPAGNGIILFYNVCHQPQVVTDQRFTRGGIPGAHGGEGGLFLLGGKRLGKAAGFQPEGQVEQMRSSRLQKKP